MQHITTYYRPQRSWGKVIFSEACVKNSVHRWGERGRGHPWQGCVCGRGVVHGRGSCVGGGYAWHTVNERAVRILLECILVGCTNRSNLFSPLRIYGLYFKRQTKSNELLSFVPTNSLEKFFLC